MANSDNKRKKGKHKGKRKKATVGPPKPPTVKQSDKKRMAVLEAVMSQGIDQLISEVQRIDYNVNIIAGALDDIDINVATLREIFKEKGIVSAEEFFAKKEVVIEAKRKAIEAAKEAQEAAREELTRKAKEMEEHPDVDPELVAMKQNAEVAGEEVDHPEGAYIFGGG